MQASSDQDNVDRPKPRRAACVACHQRKIRCDAPTIGVPCSNCRLASRTDCRLHQKRKRGRARPAFEPASVSRTSPSKAVIRSKPLSSDDESHDRRRGSALASINSTSSLGPRNEYFEDSSEEVHSRECRTHLVEFIDQQDIWHRPIDQSSRIAYVGTDVSNVNFLVRQQAGQAAAVHHYPTNRLARRYTAHEPDRLPVEAFELPDKNMVDELLTAYFEKVNPGFPVVDEEIFMTQYRARDPTSPPSLLLLQAILMVGAHVSSPSPLREKLKATFFRKAKILFDTRFERNRDTVVQAALLLTWHSDGPEDVAANAWFWIGVAARTALGLGMHRDAEPSTLVSHNKSMWRRVWWLLFQLDVLLSLQYGRPQAINLEECDTKKLLPSDFERCGANTAVDFVIQFTELTIIISGILRKVFGPRINPEQRKEAISKADTALARWTLYLPSHLRLTLSLELWPAVLHLAYNNALILLHRPRPHTMDVPHESGPNDADICSAAAGVIQSIFEGLRERGLIKYLWVGSLNSLFTAMVQLSVEVRISNPVLAISALRRYDSTLCSLQQLAEYWPNAEAVLHFFENSTRLQRPDLRSISDWPAVEKSHAEQAPDDMYAHYPLTPGLAEQPAEGGRSENLAQNTGDSEQASALNIFGDFSHWRQLFQFTDETQAQGSDFLHSRDEWREIYWQEPGFVEDFPY